MNDTEYVGAYYVLLARSLARLLHLASCMKEVMTALQLLTVSRMQVGFVRVRRDEEALIFLFLLLLILLSVKKFGGRSPMLLCVERFEGLS